MKCQNHVSDGQHQTVGASDHGTKGQHQGDSFSCPRSASACLHDTRAHMFMQLGRCGSAEESFYKLLPAQKTGYLCQSWQARPNSCESQTAYLR